MFKKSLTLDAETIDLIADRVLEQMPKSAPVPTPSGDNILAQLLSVLISAGTNARMDGKITGGDVIVAMLVAMSFVLGGAIVSAAKGKSYYLGDFSFVGVVIMVTGLTIDYINLWGVWADTFGQFLDYLERKSQSQTESQEAEAVAPIPVFSGDNGTSVIDVEPEMQSQDRLIRLRPSERLVSRQKLCSYLLWAFEHTTDDKDGWTRDRAGEYGIGQKEWADIQAFVSKWDQPDKPLWKTKNRPTLDKYIASLCNL